MAGRVFLLCVAFWGVVLVPSLCAAGVLSECCTDSPKTSAPQRDTCAPRTGQHCCDQCPQPDPSKAPQPRECIFCAHLCKAMVHTQPESARLHMAAMQVQAVCVGHPASAFTPPVPGCGPFLGQEALTTAHPVVDIILPLLI